MHEQESHEYEHPITNMCDFQIDEPFQKTLILKIFIATKMFMITFQSVY